MNNVLFPQTLSDLMHHSQFYDEMTSLSSFFAHKDGYSQLRFAICFRDVDTFSVISTQYKYVYPNSDTSTVKLKKI